MGVYFRHLAWVPLFKVNTEIRRPKKLCLLLSRVDRHIDCVTAYGNEKAIGIAILKSGTPRNGHVGFDIFDEAEDEPVKDATRLESMQPI